MNLKHFYYRTYFDEGIELAQPPKDSESRKSHIAKNEVKFKEYNSKLMDKSVVNKHTIPEQLKVVSLFLKVLNPGLLPGTGYPHEIGYQGEFKLGFSFDHTTGLPVLPGSSVKGIIRSVFPQAKSDDKIDPKSVKGQKSKFIFQLLQRLEIANLEQYSEDNKFELINELEQAIFCGVVRNEDTNNPNEKYKRLPMSQHDCFLDAMPVEFRNGLLGRDALTPHGKNPLENPTPLPFIKVMPEVVFGFYFKLYDTQIGNICITKEHKKRLFTEILCTVGAGAKTNVGYGQFESLDKDARIRFIPPKGSLPNDPKIEITEAPKKQNKNYKFAKSLLGKTPMGVVEKISGNSLFFRLLNVDGYDEQLQINATDNMIVRFKVGMEVELLIKEVNVAKRSIVARISNYPKE